MSEHRRNNHETVGDNASRVFVCMPYGREFTAIRMVVLISCMKNLTRNGKNSSAR